MPGSDAARKELNQTSPVRTTFYPSPGDWSAAPAESAHKYGFNVLLLSCALYNGAGAHKGSQTAKECNEQACCCSDQSAVLHFKGRLKTAMHYYWTIACANPFFFQCAVLPERCEIERNEKARREREKSERRKNKGFVGKIVDSLMGSSYMAQKKLQLRESLRDLSQTVKGVAATKAAKEASMKEQLDKKVAATLSAVPRQITLPPGYKVAGHAVKPHKKVIMHNL